MTRPAVPPDDLPAETTGEELRTTLEELHTAEEQLREQNEALVAAREAVLAERVRYEELFHLAPTGYLVTDPDGVIREANAAAAGLLRRSAVSLMGKPVRVLVRPEDRPRLDRLLAEVDRTGEVRGEEFRLDAGGPAPVVVAVHVNATGRPHRRAAVFRWGLHDLTPLKEAEAKLVTSERLAAMGRAVAAIAHEGRNALQRVRACLGMLRLEVADRPAALELADRAGRALDGLTRLLDDVRAATARPALRPEPCDLRAVWREAWQQAALGRPGPEEEVAGDVRCVGDPFRLAQVFRNLFDNALAAGATRVLVSAADAELNGRPAVRVAVRDDGPGLTAEQRARLFEPFYTTRPEGTGLGMAIVRSVVEAHGGAAAAGERPAGAEILVTLPREPP